MTTALKKIRTTGLAAVLTIVILFLALIPSLSAVASPREEPRIKDLVITNSGRHLLVYFIMHNAFTKEMETGLHNGIPITFTFAVELFQVNSGFLDKKLLSLSFDHTLNYDTLKEEYHVLLSEKGQSKTITPDIHEAEKCMTMVSGLQFLAMERLQADAEYELRVKATMARKSLPFYFQYLLPWTSMWDFKTDWSTLKFRY